MLRESVFLKYLKNNVLPNTQSVLSYHEPNGDYIYLNQAVERITGYQPEDLVGYSPYSYLHPDDIQEVENKSHNPALEGKQIDSIKYRFKKKDGTYNWFESTVIPIQENQVVQKLIGITRDIQEQQLLEDSYKIEKRINEDICRAASIGHWNLDIISNKMEWSDKVYEIHGLKRSDEIDYESAITFYTPHARKKLKKAVTDCVNKGQGYDLRLPFEDAQGKQKWVRAIASPYLKRGKCERIFGIFQDITEAVESENKKISNIAQYLSIQNQQLLEFSQIASHDLRGPATSLKMLVSELKESKGKKNNDLLVSLLDEKVQLLFDKLNYLSEFTGNPFKSPKLKTFDIYECIDQVIAENQNLLQEYEVKIEKEHKEWHKISYDWLKMKSILQNIIENACYFSDSEKLSKYLKFKTIIKNNNRCIIIEDNGLGMDLKKLKDTRFRRINRFHKNLSGSGGGLFLVQTLVEGAKGEMNIYSKPGEGTVISINIDKYRFNN